jgi:amino acid permease
VSDLTYLIVALTCHFIVVIIAIMIDDIGALFDFISAFGISLLMYILPAAFYLSTSSKFMRKSERSKFENKFYETLAYLLIAFGIMDLFLGFRVCYFNLTGK